MKKICIKCGREFEASKKHRICDACANGTEDSIFKCKFCGKPISYRNVFCNSSCRSKYNLTIYQPFSDDSVKEKIKITNLNKYGCENVFSSKEVKEKIKNKHIEDYGSLENFNLYLLKKRENTCIQKYGTKCSLSNKEVNLKGVETRRNKYSKEYLNDKRKNTIKLKYGSEYEYISQVPEIKEKAKNTCIKKYGAPCYLTSEEGVEKIHEYRIKKYGTIINNNPEKAAETRKNKIQTNGYFTKSQEKLSDDLIKLLYNKELSKEFLLKNKLTFFELKEYFNCKSMTPIVNWVKRNDLRDLVAPESKSHYENDLFFLLKDFSFKRNVRILNGLEIDLYSDKYKLGIEFNGTYWHSDIYKDKNYHFNKSKLASDLGIRLIHIYEYEWLDNNKKDKILSMINIALNNVTNKIYARNCIIKQISNKEAKDFNNKNHIQGHRNAQVTYGLFYKDELVQLMSFSKTRYNRNLQEENSWEIIRGCPASNNIVVGGVSKLFSHFINDYKPNSIFSYCDFNKFDGHGYEELGMSFVGYTGPDMHWILNDGSVLNRKPSKHDELKNASVAKIFGSGSKKYLWRSDYNS